MNIGTLVNESRGALLELLRTTVANGKDLDSTFVIVAEVAPGEVQALALTRPKLEVMLDGALADGVSALLTVQPAHGTVPVLFCIPGRWCVGAFVVPADLLIAPRAAELN